MSDPPTPKPATLEAAEEIRRMGGDAVINVPMEMSNIAMGAAEVLAYGTAVKLADSPDSL